MTSRSAVFRDSRLPEAEAHFEKVKGKKGHFFARGIQF